MTKEFMLLPSVKKALRQIQHHHASSLEGLRRHTPKSLNRWVKWMTPGLSVKRWMLISATGVLLTSLGLAIWIKLTPIARLLEWLSALLNYTTNLLPSHVSGPIALGLGLGFIWWGQNRTFDSIAQALTPGTGEELVDRIRHHRRLHKGPKIVALGGGTGLSTLLRGLKNYSANITAIVTVADDGGSSGRLRREIGVLPPGDIRNCLAALADEEKLLTELFQYRFVAGDGLTGHSFGNLFLTAMSEVTGDLERAIAASSKVLAIRGRVLPATLSDVSLWAELSDGRRISGESHIAEARGHIQNIGCSPPNPPALPAAIQAIREADLVIMGPGSLYTSVIPNLLVPEIREAIALSQAPRIYVCNIMTQPGETEGYSVGDHLEAIDRACGMGLFDAVMVHKRNPSPQTLMHYAQDNSHPVFLDRERVQQLGREVVPAAVMDEDPDTGYVRHNSKRLAAALLHWYGKTLQNRWFDP